MVNGNYFVVVVVVVAAVVVKIARGSLKDPSDT